jgi:integrase
MPRLTDKPLTDNRARNAKPRDARYDIFDARTRGFGIRIESSGTKSWFVMRRVNGVMRRRTIGRYPTVPLAEARIKAQSELAAMSRGEETPKRQNAVVRDYVGEWFQKDQGGNRTRRQVENAMNLHVLPEIGGRKLIEVTRSDVNTIVDKVLARGAGVQANRVLAFLRRFFNWCVERGYLETNPTSGIPKPHREKARERVLSLDELSRVFAAGDAVGYPFGPLIQLLILTGQRRDEVAEATWDELELTHRRWTIPGGRAKNARPHVVHLADATVELLSGLPRMEGQTFLFSTRGDRPVSGFSAAKKRIDAQSHVQDWTLHDLRRSFATHATETLGISPVVVDKILNHQSGAVRGIAAVYQRGAYLEVRRDALDEWGRFIAGSQVPIIKNTDQLEGGK